VGFRDSTEDGDDCPRRGWRAPEPAGVAALGPTPLRPLKFLATLFHHSRAPTRHAAFGRRPSQISRPRNRTVQRSFLSFAAVANRFGRVCHPTKSAGVDSRTDAQRRHFARFQHRRLSSRSRSPCWKPNIEFLGVRTSFVSNDAIVTPPSKLELRARCLSGRTYPRR